MFARFHSLCGRRSFAALVLFGWACSASFLYRCYSLGGIEKPTSWYGGLPVLEQPSGWVSSELESLQGEEASSELSEISVPLTQNSSPRPLRSQNSASLPREAPPSGRLRRRPKSGICAVSSGDASAQLELSTSVANVMAAALASNPQIFRRPLKVYFDHATMSPLLSNGTAKGFLKCNLTCERTLDVAHADAILFNQKTGRMPAKYNQNVKVIKAVFSTEQLGSFWDEHLKNGIHIRMSSSLLSNQTELSIPYGCKFVRHCNTKKCPALYARKVKRHGLPITGGAEADALVASIITNSVQPRSVVLKQLGKIVPMHNFGRTGRNIKVNDSLLSNRQHYADGSKRNIFKAYPFAYVPENKWQSPWGYVSEKPYDAYMAGTLPIWQGGIWPGTLHYFFPPTKDQKQTMLLVKDYPGWPDNASALAAHILRLAKNDTEFSEYFDWDDEWMRTGPLSRACNDGPFCKLCTALHVMKGGYCPPFM